MRNREKLSIKPTNWPFQQTELKRKSSLSSMSTNTRDSYSDQSKENVLVLKNPVHWKSPGKQDQRKNHNHLLLPTSKTFTGSNSSSLNSGTISTNSSIASSIRTRWILTYCCRNSWSRANSTKSGLRKVVKPASAIKGAVEALITLAPSQGALSVARTTGIYSKRRESLIGWNAIVKISSSCCATHTKSIKVKRVFPVEAIASVTYKRKNKKVRKFPRVATAPRSRI
mgnify:CR=1 FL=1